MKGFRTLLLVALVVFVGYTYWELTRLQADVKELKAAVARKQVAPTGAGDKDAAILLAQATEDLKRARIHLEMGQTWKAKRELNSGLQKLTEASKLSKGDSKSKELTQAWDGMKRQVDKLWKQFAKESKPK
ncbi:MAG: hypothetical protein Q7N50_06830 [Armatimonadota bacterium]|nr:hypothetical protein [Armatimonadota bacterium]